MPIKRREKLATGWRWRLSNSNGNANADAVPTLKNWSPTTTFPSVIQMELLAQGVVPNPSVGENERHIQWVSEADWEYSCSFQTPEGVEKATFTDLVFEGLDTFATVTLNDEEILKSDNMFVPYRRDIKLYLKPAGQHNTLAVVFESPLKVGTALEKQFGERISLVRDKRRNHIRKAQCHWGWDWGPIMMTAGPWMPIYLDIYDARVDNVYVVSNLTSNHSNADLSIDIQAAGSSAMTAKVTVLDQDQQEVHRNVIVPLDEVQRGLAELSIPNPKLWWTNGLGAQHLYSVVVSLEDNSGSTLDNHTTRFGVRTIRVIQRALEDAPGKTFMFNINGHDIFAQGANWIPADVFIPNISRERYYSWMKLAKYNHANMVRVWGGGIYETDDFFDACDELGILVWHDFAFACGDYPIHQAFLDNIKLEAEAQTIRLRNRASLAIWAGDNEDFLIADWLKVEYDYTDIKGPFEDTKFPQRKIYLQLLPEICEKFSPNTQYWPSSPWGEGENSFDSTFGDIHQWAVWHADKPYQNYKDLSGRFVSEFGMHGYPIQRTVLAFAPEAKDRFPQSRIMDCHNKDNGSKTRIARYLSENFRYDMKFENFVYCSHLLQSEANSYALRDWKRKFGGKGREYCAGALIWQLNDIYPSTSWAYIDYYLRPKPAFYSIRRNFAPISVGSERTPGSRWIDENKPSRSYIPSFAVFAHNNTREEIRCKMQLKAYDFYVGKAAKLDNVESDVTLSAGYNTELLQLKPHASWTEGSLIILQVTLVDPVSGKTLARFVDWPEPFRYLLWPADTKVTVSVEPLRISNSIDDQGIDFDDEVTVVANQPIKGCWMEPMYDGTESEDEPEPLWTDNMFDLLPGEEMKVKVRGLRGRNVKVRFLADWEVGKKATVQAVL
ncbi:uncharacterized protein A1O9_01960 [Exophiala aquamarina CBS 119918]|uniref:Beta-mannosidase B n=1 Tax=Exophiala aquamarina CBS 119918 TaxID=1182545 RepID=A0A072PXS6_9EURO|nr:uncharacterized protein A1O9_01960 [Exophiala aquamarina CBS 119918]KEF60400.1 hypothetical protein A1O9_01960 [Exophiala aquamarina CBS 119918]